MSALSVTLQVLGSIVALLAMTREHFDVVLAGLLLAIFGALHQLREERKG